MKVSSGQWEFFLMTLFFVGVALVVVTYEQAASTLTGTNIQGAIKTLATLVGEVLVFSMPFYSIAIANLRVDDIKAIFANTSPGDFVSIHGSISTLLDMLWRPNHIYSDENLRYNCGRFHSYCYYIHQIHDSSYLLKWLLYCLTFQTFQ
jgi:hypothetical protein